MNQIRLRVVIYYISAFHFEICDCEEFYDYAKNVKFFASRKKQIQTPFLHIDVYQDRRFRLFPGAIEQTQIHLLLSVSDDTSTYINLFLLMMPPLLSLIYSFSFSLIPRYVNRINSKRIRFIQVVIVAHFENTVSIFIVLAKKTCRCFGFCM